MSSLNKRAKKKIVQDQKEDAGDVKKRKVDTMVDTKENYGLDDEEDIEVTLEFEEVRDVTHKRTYRKSVWVAAGIALATAATPEEHTLKIESHMPHAKVEEFLEIIDEQLQARLDTTVGIYARAYIYRYLGINFQNPLYYLKAYTLTQESLIDICRAVSLGHYDTYKLALEYIKVNCDLSKIDINDFFHMIVTNIHADMGTLNIAYRILDTMEKDRKEALHVIRSVPESVLPDVFLKPNFPWTQLIVAGGFPTGLAMIGGMYPGSDLDFFIIGPDRPHREDNFRRVIQWFRDTYPDCLFIANSKVCCVYVPGLTYYMQVVKTDSKNAADIMSEFDLGCCKVQLNQQRQLLGTCCAAISIMKNVLVDTGTCQDYRLIKWSKRFQWDYPRELVNNHLFEHRTYYPEKIGPREIYFFKCLFSKHTVSFDPVDIGSMVYELSSGLRYDVETQQMLDRNVTQHHIDGSVVKLKEAAFNVTMLESQMELECDWISGVQGNRNDAGHNHWYADQRLIVKKSDLETQQPKLVDMIQKMVESINKTICPDEKLEMAEFIYCDSDRNITNGKFECCGFITPMWIFSRNGQKQVRFGITKSQVRLSHNYQIFFE